MLYSLYFLLMYLFILFVIQFFDRIFEDILYVISGINWLISDEICCRSFQHHFLQDRIPICIFQCINKSFGVIYSYCLGLSFI